jgi:hypothetical protein
MATFTGKLALSPTIAQSEVEEVLVDYPIWIGPTISSTATYYKCRATSTVDPSGYITWVNTTGDETDRPNPGGTIGPTQIVMTWIA